LNIYLNKKQRSLLLEALDMLLTDYPDGHPEEEAILNLEDKLRKELT